MGHHLPGGMGILMLDWPLTVATTCGLGHPSIQNYALVNG